MSSLSGLPLRQDIAVTGSVDQRGMIQPVGGINTKIEGFFKACQLKGLSGTQGMIIPKDNVKNLMLSDEILEAVKKNMFHIYAVSTIEQGLQILTGKDPGKISSDGSFQPDTIHFLVNQKRVIMLKLYSYEKETSIFRCSELIGLKTQIINCCSMLSTECLLFEMRFEFFIPFRLSGNLQ